MSKVILTAPGKGDIKNIVAGINHSEIAEDDTVLSAASCTTNAIVPPLKVIQDTFGIESGHVETVHAFTNDQNLIDNYHKADLTITTSHSTVVNAIIVQVSSCSHKEHITIRVNIGTNI